MAGRWMGPLLFGTSAHDPLVFGAVTGVLLLTALCASAIPGLRAARVDPTIALKGD